jgi:hypothetical protein
MGAPQVKTRESRINEIENQGLSKLKKRRIIKKI